MRLLLLAALMVVPIVAYGHEAPAAVGGPDVLMVPLPPQERTIMLQMCEAAVWANRQQFDGSLCMYFRSKFEAAERAAAAAPVEAPKKD